MLTKNNNNSISKVPGFKSTPCKLVVALLFTKQFEIRFDKTCLERVHAMVVERESRKLLFAVVLKTEEARAIYRELLKRGASRDKNACTA